MTQLQHYIAIALGIIPQDEAAELLRDYGYEGQPSVALVEQAFYDQKNDFVVEFAELADEAMKQPFAQQKIKEYFGTINKGTGKNKDQQEKTPQTEEQKIAQSENGIAWFNAITSGFKNLLEGSSGFMSVLNGSASAPYNAQIQIANANAETEKTKQYLIGGAIALVVLVVICIMFYSIFGKR